MRMITVEQEQPFDGCQSLKLRSTILLDAAEDVQCMIWFSYYSVHYLLKELVEKCR